MSSVFIYIIIVFPLAFKNDVIARYLGKLFSQTIFSNKKNETYWTVVDRVKRKRAYIILALIFLILGISYLAYQLFVHTTYLHDTYIYNDVWFSIILLVVAYFAQEFIVQNGTHTDHTKHVDRVTIQKILENLSKTAGIETPQLIMYAGNMPKLFLHLRTIGAPQLHVSTSLLQYFSVSEAEAYIAHEIGHYLSDEISTRRTVEWLITITKVVGLLSFLLLLGTIHPFLPLIWLGMYVAIVVGIFLDEHKSLNNTIGAGLVFLVMNPIHLIIVLITGFIYYTMNYGEAIYADLKALELTRHPQALYSALNKVLMIVQDETYQEFAYYSPFFLASTSEKDQSFEEQLIEERLRLIKSFDPTVTESYSPIKLLACSVCGHTLTQIDALGPHDIQRKAWVCGVCINIWFDKGSFYSLSSIDTKDYFVKYLDSGTQRSNTQQPYMCPHCLVPLFDIHGGTIPKDIHIYSCSSCQGNLVSINDFLNYTQYRLSL
ncbi:M48 family metalloprotease [Candidatus Kaiserbacteria bacterium]|nr:MAG: M48 family metalloprotease [Candidatus Kaiserbacteria bacterium]